MIVRPVVGPLALLAVTVLLSACAGQTAGPAGPADPGVVAPSAGASSAPSPFGHPTATISEPVNTITPQPRAEGLVAQRWSRTQAVPGAAAVLVYGTLTGGPPCSVLGRVTVTETDTTVEITTYVGRQPGADCGGAQIELAFPYVTRVDLKAPIGTRTVRDGA